MPSPVSARYHIGALAAPAYLWLTVAIFLPLAAMLYFSFLDVAPINRESHWSLTHYRAFAERDLYQILTWRSLKLGLEVTFWCAVLGYPTALVLARHVRGRWREALFLLIIVPFWSNALVRVFSWTMVLRSGGLVDTTVHWLWPGAPTLDLLFTWNAMVLGLVHSFLPYMILTCYISIQAIDSTLIEAARTLGATRWVVFRRILLPLSLPGLLAGTILIFIPVIGAFMEPRILGGKAGTLLGTVIEDQFTVVFNWPRGAALSFILLAIVLLILAASWPLLRRHMTLGQQT